METLRRQVDAAFAGRRVVAVDTTGLRSVRRHAAPGELAERVVGTRLVGVGRRGKYLVARLDPPQGPERVLVVHLRMSGQLRRARVGDPLAPHTHVVVGFDDGSELRFVDPRTFGEVYACGPGGTAEVSGLAGLGPDVYPEPPGPATLGRLLAGRRRALKATLLDQTIVAGLGNIYTDEVLWAARLAPGRPAGSLGPGAWRRLARALATVVPAAVEAGGSTLGDGQYCDLDGRPGRYQEHHAVHARAGRPCPRCGRPLVGDRTAGRGTTWCPRCQR